MAASGAGASLDSPAPTQPAPTRFVDSADFAYPASLRQNLLALPIPDSPTWRALLHYRTHSSTIPKHSKKSTFFLHKKGHKSPQLEYLATIEALVSELDSAKGFSDNDSSQENSIACAYPARLELIISQLKSALDSSDLDSHDESKESIRHSLRHSLSTLERYKQSTTCKGLQEFLALVPVDEIWLEFAAESDIYPGSSMGHIYLRLLGESRQDIDTQSEGTTITRKKGDMQEYGMSYYAIMSEFFNPFDYIRAMFGSLTGYYALAPYGDLSTEYLDNQSRALYRFKLESSPAQRELFLLHLWELKDKQIHYAFITHNCTDGIAQILGVLDSSYAFKKRKPFTTPATYIKHLDSASRISAQEWLAPERKQRFMARFGANDVLHSYPNTKLSLAYEQDNLLSISFAPIYSAITSADSSYKEHVESRLLAIEGKVALDSRGDWGAGANLGANEPRTFFPVFLSQIELLHLYSLADFYRTRTLSKLLSFRLESNLYQHEAGNSFGAGVNRTTRLFPTFEGGLGLSAYSRHFALFALPFLGYRYEIIHNPYIAMRAGVIARFPKIKAIVESSVYYDILGNNRGYDTRLRAFLGLSLYASRHFALDVFVDSSAYWSLFGGSRVVYAREQLWQTKAGVSLHF